MAKPFMDVLKIYEKDSFLKTNDVQILKDWMQKEAHLPQINELQIILFLQSCYYKIEDTKTCIENFYSLRSHCPEIFADRNLTTNKILRQQLNTFLVTPLAGYDDNSVMFIKFMDVNPEVFDMKETLKLMDMLTILAFLQDGPSNGHIVVGDAYGTQFGHLLKFNVSLLRKFSYYVQVAFPIRVKAIHVFNTTAVVYNVYSLVKTFLPENYLNMIRLHPTSDSLHKVVPQEIMPKDYGGKAPTCQELHELQIEKCEANEKFFVEDEKEKADESRRVKKLKNLDQIFGTEGTFKRLEID